MSTVTITVLPTSKSIEVPEGTNLWAAIREVVPTLPEQSPENCGDAAHIFVIEGRKGISKTTREENEKLDTIVGVGSKSRIACFAQVLGTENVKVELLGEFSGF